MSTFNFVKYYKFFVFQLFFFIIFLIDIPLIDKALAISAAKATIARKQTVRNILEESVERKKKYLKKII
jgi:hypothetical protein